MRFLPVILLSCVCAWAQQHPPDVLHRGANEWGLQTGGGTAIPGGAGNRSYWALTGRYSRILTPELGSGPLRGNLQYGVEVTPVLVMRQSTTVYAGGFSPLQLRYNFTARRHVVPYLEIGGSVLGSAEPLPEGTSRFNFLTDGGIGFQVLRARLPAIQAGMRYQHISNAGLTRPNPGINSLYFFSGVSWWK